MGWEGYVASIGNMRGAFTVLVGRLERKRTFKRRRRGCEDNIKIDLQEFGCGAWAGFIWLKI
jgi:hypothetical protein